MEWLEEVASAQINLSNSIPQTPPELTPGLGDKVLAAVASDEDITMDRYWATTSTMTPGQQATSFLTNQLRGQPEPDWNKLCDILRKNPSAVVHVQYDDGSNALHLACGRNAPFKVIQLIVQQHPNAKSRGKTTLAISHCILHVRSTSPSKWLIS